MPRQWAAATTRVVKKLNPMQPGAQRWSQRYGDALVCARYRVDESGERRYTTVELCVDEAPTVASRDRATIVGVRIAYEETALRHKARDAGGQWDRATKVWRLPRDRAKRWVCWTGWWRNSQMWKSIGGELPPAVGGYACWWKISMSFKSR
jgi:hypothetical protein